MYKVTQERMGDNGVKLEIVSSETMKIVNRSSKELLPGIANKIGEGAAGGMNRFNGNAKVFHFNA